jgi:hypothetical protein
LKRNSEPSETAETCVSQSSKASAWFRPHPWFFWQFETLIETTISPIISEQKRMVFQCNPCHQTPKIPWDPMGLWRHWPQVPARVFAFFRSLFSSGNGW